MGPLLFCKLLLAHRIQSQIVCEGFQLMFSFRWMYRVGVNIIDSMAKISGWYDFSSMVGLSQCAVVLFCLLGM